MRRIKRWVESWEISWSNATEWKKQVFPNFACHTLEQHLLLLSNY